MLNITKKNAKKGFTLIEIVIVLVIMAIMAVIAVPSLMAYTEHGRQTGRENIARTVYLAAQSGLTRMKLDGKLSEYVKYDTAPDGSETTTVIDPTVISVPIDISTNSDAAKDDSANKDYMYYLTIYQGAGDTFKNLVGDYLADKSILSESLVLEFNAKTGVVKSVFYSENLNEVWDYATDAAAVNKRGNLVSRDDGALRTKKQGFYGVATTGVVPPEAIPISVGLFDGSEVPLENTYTNVLYVQATVPKGSDKSYTLDAGIANTSFTASGVPSSLSAAISTGTGIYKYSSTDPLTDTIIWILDIVDNGSAYSLVSGETPTDISVTLTEIDTGRALQSNTHNSHFASARGDTYTVADTRHLKNVRDAASRTFYQTNDIKISNYADADLTQFEPIDTFSGKYYATKSGGLSHQISNLKIAGTGANTGLFGTVSGEIRGVSLASATISAGSGNVGAIAGKLDGGTISQCSSYANVVGTGAANTGGLVGEIASGTLEQSYNGGYDNAPLDVNSAGVGSDKTGKVTADAGNIGGLVGKNVGTIKNSYNNARVNIEAVLVDADNLSHSPTYSALTGAANLGGIVGQNAAGGTVQYTYATNFVGTYSGKKSGGIVGDGNAKDSLFLANGTAANGAKAVSKAGLKKMVAGSTFTEGKDYTGGATDPAAYPYPQLPSNKHTTKWEDIKSGNVTTAGLKYYELYNDGTFSYSTGGTDGLAKRGDKVTVNGEEVDKLIVNDGYCLEFAYASQIDIYFSKGDNPNGYAWLYRLKDRNNSSTNPKWAWDTTAETGLNKSQMDTLPIKYASGSDTRFRLYFSNNIVESISEAVPLRIRALVNGENVLDGATKYDATAGTFDSDVFFNQLFAGAIFKGEKLVEAPTQTEYTVRSPRQLNNIGLRPKTRILNYNQNANMDFEIYRKELNTGSNPVVPHEYSKMDFMTKLDEDQNPGSSVVTGEYSPSPAKATYDGGHYYIKKVQARHGLFYAITGEGIVKNIILLDSAFVGNYNAGSIASESSGTVTNCEVSNVTVRGTANVGGIVGRSSNTVNNCYFNSTYRDPLTGVYATPISGGATTTGGLVGANSGGGTSIGVANSYITAVGPAGHPTIGSGNPAGKNVYYLTVAGYNSDAVTGINQGEGLRPEDAKWKTVMPTSDWEAGSIPTTLETFQCKGLAYPFPKIKGSDHYFDWPILLTTLKYYEKYNDGSYGYYYMAGKDEPVDALKYDPVNTAVEEGYLLDLYTKDDYNIRFGESTRDDIAGRKSEVVDGRRVIILKHSEIESLIKATNIAKDGITPVKIRASSVTSSQFANELYGLDTHGFVFFDPLFAKQIFLSDDKKTPDPIGKNTITDQNRALEVRSPRQMLHINSKLSTELKNFDYRQTLSVNFATEPIKGGRPNYLKDGVKLGNVGQNVINGFGGSYDGGFPRDAGGKLRYTAKPEEKGYRIYYLTMNVSIHFPIQNNTGSAFGNLGSDKNTTATIKNLEFIDTQIRYAEDGMGGGTVANVNYGTIDNVRVLNLNNMSLFTDENGKTDTQFCADWSNKIVMPYASYGHAHGGIAAVAYGEKAIISNCFVGTNSDNVQEIFDNKTNISCNSGGINAGTDNNRRLILMGGIVGTASGGANVVSCTNVATIAPNAENFVGTAGNVEAAHCIGGIVGRLGNADRNNTGGSQRVNTSYANIIGSYNAGSVRVPLGYVGGIVGRTGGEIRKTGNTYSQVISCYNTGRVNVESDGAGVKKIQPKKGGALRIGGISGEVDLTDFKNCYNIGYVSGEVTTSSVAAAGAIVGQPTYDNITMFGCYSLAANQLRPVSVVGKLYESATVNGMKNINAINGFGSFWESRQNLRNNAELVSQRYVSDNYPTAPTLPWPFKPGDNKLYPVFTSNPNTFYIYPELTSFEYGGVYYKNPHITPWESIDAMYDATLKYYEKYNDNSVGYYNLSARGEKLDQLSLDKIVTEDGYVLEIGAEGNYKIVINGKTTFKVAAQKGSFGGVANIIFTPEMKKALKVGYNKIQLFTTLPEKDGSGKDIIQNIEDNKINRMVGSSTTLGGTTGQDVYFDQMFPREIQYADATKDVATLSPLAYAIRSPRHIDNIGKLPKKVTGASKKFKQEIDIDFATYNFSSYTDTAGGYDKDKGYFTRSIVEGDFTHEYLGQYNTISNVKIVSDKANVGLFENCTAARIEQLKLENIDYSGSAGTLSMGGLAAKVSGNANNINTIAVINPKLSSTSPTGAPTIGGIIGFSEQAFSDVYLMVTDQEGACPITADSSTAILGGICGESDAADSGSRLLYFAPAPGNNPIFGKTPATSTAKDVYYLADGDYNGTVTASVGAKKTTAEFRTINISAWSHWGKIDSYPYPSLTSIAPPTEYPKAAPPSFTLAYYEQYDNATGKFGWFYEDEYGEKTDTLKKADATKYTSGYVVIVPDDTATYGVKVGGTGVTSPVTPLDGKNVIQLAGNGNARVLVEVTRDGKTLAGKYKYYVPYDRAKIFENAIDTP